MTKFSIVIAARNEEEHIGRFLDSIDKGSEFEDYEVIVVDGNSTDDTRKIAEEKGAKVVEGPGEGLTTARNLGWKSSEGEYVGLYDADEYFREGYLDEVAERLDGEVKVVTEGGTRVTDGWISETMRIEAKANINDFLLARVVRKLVSLV